MEFARRAVEDEHHVVALACHLGGDQGEITGSPAALRIGGRQRVAPNQQQCQQKEVQPHEEDDKRVSCEHGHSPQGQALESLSQKVWHGFATRVFHRLKTGAPGINALREVRAFGV